MRTAWLWLDARRQEQGHQRQETALEDNWDETGGIFPTASELTISAKMRSKRGFSEFS